MQKHLSKWHGRMGVFAATIAIYLSLTGLLLNHSHDLGLNNSRLSNSLILYLYGIKSPAGQSARTQQYRIDKLGETLFMDEHIIGQYSSALIGASTVDQIIAIALSDSIILLTAEGEIIETLTRSSGLPGLIQRIGKTQTGLLIQSGQKIYASDANLLNWQAADNLKSRTHWSDLEPIPSGTENKLKLRLPAYGPSWERVLQDLHSGRLFKLPGTLLIDLTGVLLLLLSISGITSFTLRKKAYSKTDEKK